jgi:hypothetical protein
MTSNAEEQANASGAARVHPPKVTKRANVMPPKRPVARGKPTSGKKASSAERRLKSEKAASARAGSKSARVLSLLRRPDGASLKELMTATGWLAHSVCGFLSEIVAKRMRLKLVCAKSEDGERHYTKGRLAQFHANKEPPRIARRFFFVRLQVGPEAISHERLRSYLLIELLGL